MIAKNFDPLAGRYIGVFIYGRIRVNSRELFALSISRIAAVHVQVVVEHTYLGRGLARRLASDMLCAAKHCLLLSTHWNLLCGTLTQAGPSNLGTPQMNTPQSHCNVAVLPTVTVMGSTLFACTK